MIQAEVEAREMSDTMKIQEKEGTETTPTPKRGLSPGTANSLLARSGDGSGIRRAFCNGEHYSSACEEVKEIQKRKNILRRDERCCLCLAVGHRANQCTRKKKCRVCDRTDHHQSVCEMSSNQSRSETPAAPTNAKTKEHREPSASKKPPQNIKTTSTARSKVQVLLQTARTYAYVENGTKLLPVRVLLDRGSQTSYITNHLKRKLGLIPIETETLNLNTFGNETFSRRDCDLIKLRLQGKHGGDVNISALSFEAICSPVPSKVSLHEHPHLLDLDLADRISGNMDSQDNIYVLIGSAYWDIITGEVARGDDKLVAVNSKFAWFPSVPTKGDSGTAHFTTPNVIFQKPYDFMESQNQATELANSLNRFWDIESAGITETSSKVNEHEQFLRFIKFDKDEGRYEVDLPWREQTCKQSDNFDLCVTRLELFERTFEEE